MDCPQPRERGKRSLCVEAGGHDGDDQGVGQHVCYCMLHLGPKCTPGVGIDENAMGGAPRRRRSETDLI
ncbi:hypothetical protein NL676_018504 [Syzygium grande]|nr:hypothetical protein NL676_018504 [Syzygium grande]